MSNWYAHRDLTSPLKVGDVVGSWYSYQDGLMTCGIVTDIDGEHVTIWDVADELHIKYLWTDVWPIPEEELDHSMSFAWPERRGIFTWRQLVSEAREKLTKRR